MSKPLFQYDVYSLQFTSNLLYPLTKPVQTLQVKDRTNAGTWVVQNLGDSSIQSIIMSFDRLNKTDYDALYNWIVNIVDWAVTPFSYTDEKGASQLVRIISDQFSFQEIRHEIYAGELQLEVIG